MLCRSKVVLTIGGGVSIKLLWIGALKFSFFEIICLDKLFWFEYDIKSKESIWPCHLYKCDRKHIPYFPELKNLYINTFLVKGLHNQIFIYNVSNSTLKYSFMQAFPLDLVLFSTGFNSIWLYLLFQNWLRHNPTYSKKYPTLLHIVTVGMRESKKKVGLLEWGLYYEHRVSFLFRKISFK